MLQLKASGGEKQTLTDSTTGVLVKEKLESYEKVDENVLRVQGWDQWSVWRKEEQVSDHWLAWGFQVNFMYSTVPVLQKYIPCDL
eukprot:scaffold251218_cov72-Attheya_sp.AAC.2